jgi:hypothetical protein
VRTQKINKANRVNAEGTIAVDSRAKDNHCLPDRKSIGTHLRDHLCSPLLYYVNVSDLQNTGHCEMMIARKPILHDCKMCLSNIRATGCVRGVNQSRRTSREMATPIQESMSKAEKSPSRSIFESPASSNNNAFERVPTPVRPNSSCGKYKCQPSDMSRGGERV